MHGPAEGHFKYVLPLEPARSLSGARMDTHTHTHTHTHTSTLAPLLEGAHSRPRASAFGGIRSPRGARRARPLLGPLIIFDFIIFDFTIYNF